MNISPVIAPTVSGLTTEQNLRLLLRWPEPAKDGFVSVDLPREPWSDRGYMYAVTHAATFFEHVDLTEVQPSVALVVSYEGRCRYSADIDPFFPYAGDGIGGGWMIPLVYGATAEATVAALTKWFDDPR